MTKKKITFSTNTVKYVAQLAHLGINEKEIEKFQKQLSQIIGFVNQLSIVNTEGIIPTSQVTGLENIFREDLITPSFSQKDVLANAPDKHNGYFKVKAVFEE